MSSLRKMRNINKLKLLGIKCNEELPSVEQVFDSDRTRNAEDVLVRMLCIHYSSYASLIRTAMDTCPEHTCFNENHMKHIENKISELGIWSYMTDTEKSSIDKNTDVESIQNPLVSENAYMLGWILGIVNHLPFPDNVCDIFKFDSTLSEIKDIHNYSDIILLRDAEDILDEMDLYYRIMFELEPSMQQFHRYDCLQSMVNPDVVYERVSAIKWYFGMAG